MSKIYLKSISIVVLLVLITTMPLFAQGTQTSIDTAQIIILAKFNMPQLNRQRTIRVFLPKGYASSNKSYPVIYMTDGQNIFKTSAAIKNTWGVDSLLNTMPASKQCIIVGIDHAGKDRITEYNPYDSNYGKGAGIVFIQFLAETLKPYIDTHYRTKKDARYTAIAGSSMGSLLAMYAAVKYPETFGNAGIFSPAFWIGLQIYTDTQASPFNKKSGFYFTCGDQESATMVNQVNKMDSLLHAKNFSFKQVPVATINVGAMHNETQWRGAFPAFYSWLIARF